MKQHEFTEFHSAATEIVAAYVYANKVDVEKLPELLQMAYRAVTHMDMPPATVHVLPRPKNPAVPIDKSVHDEYIICLEDGAKLKMLRRYLKTNFNMTFEQYRARWNLPKEYPAVAPSYAKKRSQMARASGLGRGSSKKKKK
jgi:predicted transcriptional regulator